MNRADFKPCAACGKGMMHTGVPLFWRVRVERMGVDARQVQQQAGMETFFGGNVGLADVFAGGPIATPLPGSEVTFLLCENCATGSNLPLAALAMKD